MALLSNADKPFVATQTLTKINEHLERDQGATFRGHLRELMPLMEDAYSEDNFPFRSHMGASLIGRECEREIWYGFRWASLPRFDGRLLRLFNRGHLEEARFLALLKMIGCEVWHQTEDGKQFRISDHNGHYGGSMDGVIRGIPEMPETPLLAEFKTHNANSFSQLKKEGVRASKFEHYVQMQQYMGYNGLSHALYMAVSKNDDSLYAEIVPFNAAACKVYSDRAGRLIQLRTPPARLSETPAFYKCRFCNFSDVCHKKKPPHRNCRTCVHSSPVEDGKWACSVFNDSPNFPTEDDFIDKQRQLESCSHYEEGLSIDPEDELIPF